VDTPELSELTAYSTLAAAVFTAVSGLAAAVSAHTSRAIAQRSAEDRERHSAEQFSTWFTQTPSTTENGLVVAHVTLNWANAGPTAIMAIKASIGVLPGGRTAGIKPQEYLIPELAPRTEPQARALSFPTTQPAGASLPSDLFTLTLDFRDMAGRAWRRAPDGGLRRTETSTSQFRKLVYRLRKLFGR
jgi:hypothetical protein